MKKLLFIIICTFCTLIGFAQESNDCFCTCTYDDLYPNTTVILQFNIDSDIYTMDDYYNFLFLDIDVILRKHVAEYLKNCSDDKTFIENLEKMVLEKISNIEFDILTFNYEITNNENDF